MTKELSREYLVHEYLQKERSTYDIAVECKTYPNRIRRLLKKYHIPLRDKSEAQVAALQSGRHKHPTKGNKRPEDIRIKISEGVARAWSRLDPIEKQKRINTAKEQWEMMTDAQRERFRKLAAEAVRKAAEEGSALEKFFLVELIRHGYSPDFHRTHIVSNERLHIDLFLSELKVAIEVDGPAHFFPIWGEDNLAKHLTTDSEKTGLILAQGYVLIRIKNLLKNISKIQYRKVLTKLLDTLKSIQEHFPEPSHRLIEIELN
jgi:very-short-patch-repair endonuclease